MLRLVGFQPLLHNASHSLPGIFFLLSAISILFREVSNFVCVLSSCLLDIGNLTFKSHLASVCGCGCAFSWFLYPGGCFSLFFAPSA